MAYNPIIERDREARQQMARQLRELADQIEAAQSDVMSITVSGAMPTSRPNIVTNTITVERFVHDFKTQNAELDGMSLGEAVRVMLRKAT